MHTTPLSESHIIFPVKVVAMSTGRRILILLPLLVVLSASALLVLPKGGREPRLAAGGGGNPGRLAAWETGPFQS